MILRRIKFNNYNIFKDVDIEIPLGVTGILGQWVGSIKSNGSGKTTLLDSIPFVLTGEIVSGGTLKDIIGNFGDTCRVDHWYQLSNNQFLHIARGVNKSGGGFVEAYLGDGITETPITETKNLIKQKLFDLLGFDKEMLLATSFFQQDAHDNFTKKAGPTKRKEYIRKVRGVSIFDQCYKDVDQRTKPIEEKIKNIIAQKQAFENEILEIESLDIQKDNFASKISELSSMILTAKTNQTVLRKTKEELISKNAVISKVKEQISAITTSIFGKTAYLESIRKHTNYAKQEIVELNKKILQNKELIRSIQEKSLQENESVAELLLNLESIDVSKLYNMDRISEIIADPIDQEYFNKLIADQKEIENSIYLFGTDIKRKQLEVSKVSSLEVGCSCPTCTQLFEKKYLDAYIIKTRSEISQLLAEKTRSESALSEILANKAVIDKLIASNSEKENKKRGLQDKINQLTEKEIGIYKLISSKVNIVNNYLSTITSAYAQIAEAEASIRLYKEKITLQEGEEITLIDEIKNTELLRENLQNNLGTDHTSSIDSTEIALNNIALEISKYEKEILAFEAKLATKAEYLSKINGLDLQIDEYTKKLKAYEKISHVFSKNGVSNSFVHETVLELQDLSNKYLWQIDSTKSVAFSTQSSTGAETLDIYVKDLEEVRIYEKFSGGEKTLVNLSIRLALSNLINKRSNKKIGFVVLDEVFGALCGYNRPRVAELINQIRNSFSQMFIISHTDIQDQFEHLLLIERHAKHSTIRRIR